MQTILSEDKCKILQVIIWFESGFIALSILGVLNDVTYVVISRKFDLQYIWEGYIVVEYRNFFHDALLTRQTQNSLYRHNKHQ